MDYKALIDETNRKIISEESQIIEKNKTIHQKTKENEEYDKKIKCNLEEKLLLREICNTARKTAIDSFESLATDGVKFIFGPHIAIKVETEKEGNTPSADFKIVTKYDDYEVVTDPTDEDGGGIADIVALTTFLCMNILSGDNSAPMFLDEPTKFVSEGLASRVADFIKSITNDYDKQIIMVTHAKETRLAADKVLWVEINKDGVSHVADITENK